MNTRDYAMAFRRDYIESVRDLTKEQRIKFFEAVSEYFLENNRNFNSIVHSVGLDENTKIVFRLCFVDFENQMRAEKARLDNNFRFGMM